MRQRGLPVVLGGLDGLLARGGGGGGGGGGGARIHSSFLLVQLDQQG